MLYQLAERQTMGLMMKSLPLLLLVLASSFSGAKTLLGVNMMFIFSNVSISSLPLTTELFNEDKQIDFVFVDNASSSEAWLDVVPRYSEAAGKWILFQTASWVLLEDGAQHNEFSSFWARFQTNSSPATISPLSICAMIVDWEEASWSENGKTAAAVELETRLKDKCGSNDTIALSFSAPVSNTVMKHLEGDNTASFAMAPLTLLGIDSSLTPEVKSPADNRVFVRLTDKLCVSNASAPLHSSESRSESLLLTLSESTGSSSQDSDSSSNNDSDWKHSLRFIIPICCCTFLLGCAGLIYILLQKKPYHASETPKDDKEFTTKLSYVLTIHPI